ncbi:MAG: class I SAM-dependent methyltransferase [Rhodocyclaceae bacterium]|nr:class I SAM-dependent methyltransferase [Rhodocyclaceae bacterium]
MADGNRTSRPSFENAWRRRFEEFAALRDDDAGIAGWSVPGLETRMRAFLRVWEEAPQGNLWLDAGCGAGTYTRHLAQKGLRVIGLDYSHAATAKARERDTEHCMWGVADVTHLPLRTNTFDGAICFGVMQALSESGPAITELADRLRPGGELWVDILNTRCVANIWVRFSRWLRGKPRHLRYESPRRMKRLMEDAGLVNVRVYWIPILPARLRVLQPILESAIVRVFLHGVPGLGALLSHSCMLIGVRPTSTT